MFSVIRNYHSPRVSRWSWPLQVRTLPFYMHFLFTCAFLLALFSTCTFFAALLKPHFFNTLLPVLVARLFGLVGAGPFDVEPQICWPASALISFPCVSPACMTPSSRSAVAERDLTIQSVPACFSIKSNGCVLDEEKLAPL